MTIPGDRVRRGTDLPLVTDRLLLRPLERADAGAIFALSGEAGMMTWIPDQAYGDEAQALGVVEFLVACYADPGHPARGPFVLALCLRETAELVGHVGFSPLRESVEVGYAVGEAWQGRGFASEAVAAASRWALRTFGLPEVLGVVHAENTASCRVLEKAGFVFAGEVEGTLHGRPGMIRTYSAGKATFPGEP